MLAQGADTGGSSTQVVIGLAATARDDGGTTLAADADVHLTGRIAQFGRALAADVSRRLFERFAAAVDEAARTGTAPTPGTDPGPVRLAVGAALGVLRRLVGTRVGRLRTRVTGGRSAARSA